jgi:acetylornithine deacetylase/succinyl-diaminopimelate desuccinylase-like protein
VVGLHGGYTDPGIKTIVPASAEAKITFRLVPDQDPDRVAAAFERWLREHLPDGIDVDVERHGGVSPARTPLDHWGMAALEAAIEAVWGAPPLYTREGGSGPEEALGRVLAAPVLFLGVGLPDDRIHAPNERMVMAQFWRGLLAAGELWPALAAAKLDAADRS